jgi:hypothetical protein
MPDNNYFGKAFDFIFTVFSNERGEYMDLSSVTDSPTCYVYTSKPNNADAINGDGSPIATISSWTDHSDTGGKKITIPALTDPEPNEARTVHEYWLAVNYKLVNGGDSILMLRMIPMERPIAGGDPVDVTAADLEEIFSDIDGYVDPTEQAAKIKLAKSLIASELSNDGYKWADLYEPEDLNLAVSYRALAEIMLESRFADNARFIELGKMYRGNASTLMKSLRSRYDLNKDGAPDDLHGSGAEGLSNTVVFSR